MARQNYFPNSFRPSTSLPLTKAATGTGLAKHSKTKWPWSEGPLLQITVGPNTVLVKPIELSTHILFEKRFRLEVSGERDDWIVAGQQCKVFIMHSKEYSYIYFKIDHQDKLMIFMF